MRHASSLRGPGVDMLIGILNRIAQIGSGLASTSLSTDHPSCSPPVPLETEAENRDIVSSDDRDSSVGVLFSLGFHRQHSFGLAATVSFPLLFLVLGNEWVSSIDEGVWAVEIYGLLWRVRGCCRSEERCRRQEELLRFLGI
ncbi:unnamed protein product [Fraxinus pennsylvanica]|uniref:Uncharacterized protein n=1 Tax=Fraxinus pennsylvanica TaxID=56036 RepID=A0AAD2DL11_9LAMI|nr:unnamed protein product [Fraxinus pennsylvanica]